MHTRLTGVEKVLLQTLGHLPKQLFVLSGPSGVGKNTIIKKLLATYSPRMARVRTYTTRGPREDEIEGEQYYFVSPERFRELALSGRLMEVSGDTIGHDVYGLGHLYSMPTDVFENVPDDMHLVIAEVDVHGARLLKSNYPDAVLMFVTAPPDVLVERIEQRPDEHMTEQALAQRIAVAREHIRAARDFDFVIFNEEDRLQAAIDAISDVIHSERMRVRHGLNLEDVMPGESFNISKQ